MNKYINAILMVASISLVTQLQARESNDKIVIGEDVPNTQMLYPKLGKDRVEMKTVNRFKLYKETQGRETDRKKILSETFDTQLSLTPEIRTLRSVDSIKISPLFVTTIILPEDMVVTDAKPSFKTTTLESGENLIRFQPDKDFYIGNIPIAFSDGKKNYYMVIYVEKYFQNNNDNKSYMSRVKHRDFSIANKIASVKKDELETLMNNNVAKYDTEEKLFTIFQYKLPKALSDEEAIIIYERMVGKKGINIEDGDYVSFLYDGITYRIIRNDKQGSLRYGNRAYLIENSSMR